jgi:hypothetical protein
MDNDQPAIAHEVCRLPHVREPSSGEPDICIYCREEWVDLLTLYERDECSVRLRAEVDRLRARVTEWENALDTIRDSVLYERGPMAGEDYGPERVNAVLSIIDDNTPDSRPVAAAEDAKCERAAVVAWLRECALDPETTGAEMRLFQTYALAIERGAHRREETNE